MNPETDARQKRLRREKELLDRLNLESDYVKALAVTPVGGAPEKYIIRFSCRGIVGIDGAKLPIYGDQHEVEVYCDSDYPAEVPKLKWITPIWHPNIRHKEPKDVCVNKREWLAGLYLDHLCWQMFDMVQYRNYHAEPIEPFPLDHEVAEWVLKFAEPRGIVNRRKGISVDNKPFFRPTSAATVSPAGVVPIPSRPKVKFSTAVTPVPAARAAASTEAPVCRHCGNQNVPGAQYCLVCGKSMAKVRVKFA